MPGRWEIVVRHRRDERTSAPSKSGKEIGFVLEPEDPLAVPRLPEHAVNAMTTARAAKAERFTDSRFEEKAGTPRILLRDPFVRFLLES
jgi:hypothetical protein